MSPIFLPFALYVHCYITDLPLKEINDRLRNNRLGKKIKFHILCNINERVNGEHLSLIS